jgi:hypothetical protein
MTNKWKLLPHNWLGKSKIVRKIAFLVCIVVSLLNSLASSANVLSQMGRNKTSLLGRLYVKCVNVLLE